MCTYTYIPQTHMSTHTQLPENIPTHIKNMCLRQLLYCLYTAQTIKPQSTAT